MCARFVSRIMAAMERAVQVRWHDPFELLYNAAPSMQLSVVTAGADAPEVRAMKWGFIPGWWTQARPPRLTINTRGEDAPEKSMWRAAFRGTRCLVPAIGWYEWSTESRVDTRTGEIHEVRQPHFIHLEGLQPLALARPAAPTAPISVEVQPPGSACATAADDSSRETATVRTRSAGVFMMARNHARMLPADTDGPCDSHAGGVS